MLPARSREGEIAINVAISRRRDRDQRRDLATARSRSRDGAIAINVAISRSRDRAVDRDLDPARSREASIAVVGLELARSARTGAQSTPAIVGLTGARSSPLARARSLSLSFSENTLK